MKKPFYETYVFGWLCVGAIIASMIYFNTGGRNKDRHSIKNNDMYEYEEPEKEYEPNRQHLQSLYYENMTDTIFDNDSSGIILKVVVIDSFKFKLGEKIEWRKVSH